MNQWQKNNCSCVTGTIRVSLLKTKTGKKKNSRRKKASILSVRLRYMEREKKAKKDAKIPNFHTIIRAKWKKNSVLSVVKNGIVLGCVTSKKEKNKKKEASLNSLKEERRVWGNGDRQRHFWNPGKNESRVHVHPLLVPTHDHSVPRVSFRWAKVFFIQDPFCLSFLFSFFISFSFPYTSPALGDNSIGPRSCFLGAWRHKKEDMVSREIVEMGK